MNTSDILGYIDRRIAQLQDQRLPLPAEARYRINELRLLRNVIEAVMPERLEGIEQYQAESR